MAKSPLSISRDAVVKTAEAIYGLLHNGLEDLNTKVSALHPPTLPQLLTGKEMCYSLSGPQDDIEVRQPLYVLAGAKDLRGWICQQARQQLLDQMVGKTADRVGYLIRKLGMGKWKLTISLEDPAPEKAKEVIKGGAAEAVSAPAQSVLK